MRTIRATVDIQVGFCEETITVTVSGNYTPGVPMRGPSYASGGEPPEPAEFEYDRVTWWNPKAAQEIDITTMIPPSCEEYVSEAALEAYENGGSANDGPDPDAAYERMRDKVEG